MLCGPTPICSPRKPELVRVPEHIRARVRCNFEPAHLRPAKGHPMIRLHISRRHVCRRHRVACDATSERPIARSCATRAGAVGTDVGAATVYRVATELHERAVRLDRIAVHKPGTVDQDLHMTIILSLRLPNTVSEGRTRIQILGTILINRSLGIVWRCVARGRSFSRRLGGPCVDRLRPVIRAPSKSIIEKDVVRSGAGR